MKINAVIPAKGKTNRIDNRNLYKIGSKSLVYLACEKLMKCKNVDEVYLDTECTIIKSEVQPLISQGLKVIDRPPSLANNDINLDDVMMYALHSVSDCDLLIQTFCTFPMLTSEVIDSAIEKFVNHGMKGHDSFMLTTGQDCRLVGQSSVPQGSAHTKSVVDPQALYGALVTTLLENKKRIGKNPMLIEISKIESLDIKSAAEAEFIKRVLE